MTQWLRRTRFAHRGLHGPDTGPENSLPAFAAAVAQGYGIECDVQLLADGAVAVFHDRELTRLTGRTGRIEAVSAPDLAGLRLVGTDAAVPLLESVLALVAGRVPLYLELKPQGPPGPLVAAVLARLAGYPGPCLLASFDPWTLAAVARRAPGRIRCLIASDFAGQSMPGCRRFCYRHLLHALIARPHCIAYDIRALPSVAVSLARCMGLPVLLWTVRSREDMDKVLRYGDTVVFEGFSPPSPGNT